MGRHPNPIGSRTTVAAIRFKADVFSDLETYAEKYFATDRTKAVNHILKQFFRQRKNALEQMSDTKGYTKLTAF